MNKIVAILTVAAVASFFASCGDSETNASNGPQTDKASRDSSKDETGVVGVETADDLPNCTTKREGETFFVEEEDASYVCEDGKWNRKEVPENEADTFDDLPNCTAKRDGDVYFVKEEDANYACENGKWNSVDGTDENEDDDDTPNSSSNESSSSSSSRTRSSSSSHTQSSSGEGCSTIIGGNSSSSTEAVSSPSCGNSFVTWNGGEGLEQVKTYCGNDTKTFGYWWGTNDNCDGGQSNITWPVAKGNDYDVNSLAPIIAECSGICGTANLDAGTLTYEPFVAIGFNIVGETAAGNPTPAAGDASAWGGVCIFYSSTIAARLELSQGDAGNARLKNGPPYVDLPKGTNKVFDFAWSDFAMPDWAIDQSGITLSGEQAAKTLVALRIKFQGSPGSYTFNIMSIGAMGGGCKTSSGSLPIPSNDGGNGGT